jgi:DNA-binding transcriptional LysR family regulator
VGWVLAASPGYLDLHGYPTTPTDLAGHRCLRLLSDRVQDAWELTNESGQKKVVRVGGTFECNDSRALGEAVYAGVGIGVRPERDVEHAQGRLVRVLPGWRFGPLPLFILASSGRRLPRVSVVIEVLKAALRSRIVAPLR